MVPSSYTYTKNNLISVAKRYQRLSYRYWWIVCGIYGDHGNGKNKLFHEMKSYQIKNMQYRELG